MRLCDYLDTLQLQFPCEEAVFYNFLCSEQLSNAPQSRLKGYMQAVNFVQHVMSVHEASPLTVSARCRGSLPWGVSQRASPSISTEGGRAQADS